LITFFDNTFLSKMRIKIIYSNKNKIKPFYVCNCRVIIVELLALFSVISARNLNQTVRCILITVTKIRSTFIHLKKFYA